MAKESDDQLKKLIKLIEPISKYYEQRLAAEQLPVEPVKQEFEPASKINNFISGLNKDAFAKEAYELISKQGETFGVDEIILSDMIRKKSGFNERTIAAIVGKISRNIFDVYGKELGLSTQNLLKLAQLREKINELLQLQRAADAKKEFEGNTDYFFKKALGAEKYGVTQADIKVWALENDIDLTKGINQYVTALNSRLEPLAPPRTTRRNPITTSIRSEVLRRDKYRCVECGNSRDETSLEIDHILPVSRGGKDTLDNLQTLCKACNAAKKNRII